MSTPVSRRYVPIREAVIATLQSASAFVDMTTRRDPVSFANLTPELFPAFGVFYANLLDLKELHLCIALRSEDGVLECGDRLLGYVEAAEDALAAVPTLGGLVKGIRIRLLRRHHAEVAGLQHHQVTLAVRFHRKESAVPSIHDAASE